MRFIHAKSRLLLAFGAFALALTIWTTADARRAPDVEILLEGGVAFPYGDLGDDWFGTLKGAGAETGYEIGGRVRYFFSPELALAPAFHFVDFGDFASVAEDLGPFEVSTSVLRYGMDLQYFFPTRGRMGRRHAVRPFLNAGAGLYNNRYRDEVHETDQALTFYETSINSYGVALRGGMRVGDFEWSIIYHINRFDTVRLSDTGFKEDYNWDFLIVRAGFAFPTR
jgi:hypothetical protein